jgi:two-component system NtrC family sensor kinase
VISFQLKERIYPNQNYVFPIEIEKNEMREFYFRIRADDQIQLPFSIGTVGQINQQLNTKDIAFGLFAGIMIAILLYNMFIFLKVREKIYGLYILYLAVIFVTQANLHGYTLRFFWPFAPEIERICVYFLIALSGITGLIFIMNYIHLDRYLKPVVKLFYGFIGVYCFALLLVGFKQYGIAFKILEINGSIIAISVLAVTYKVWRSGNKQAGNLLLGLVRIFCWTTLFCAERSRCTSS